MVPSIKMVVIYKTKFTKVFLIALALFVIAALSFTIDYYIISQVSAGKLSKEMMKIARVPFVLSGFAFIIGEGFYVYSHYLLAKAKGYSGWFVLLGLLNTFIGLVIIFLLPDKMKSQNVTDMSKVNKV